MRHHAHGNMLLSLLSTEVGRTVFEALCIERLRLNSSGYCGVQRLLHSPEVSSITGLTRYDTSTLPEMMELNPRSGL
jgi:hypothetical protein